ncbi:MAG: class 1 fructose-bisphosphatase [Bacteroidia bacterium]|nr:class 1 fructose-bisphosphatase [Bacteroidia bacterium]MDW8158015.1 class 1 fructose-bisphosphatase [Bacteroidia bacterium]
MAVSRLITLEQFIVEKEKEKSGAQGEFSMLLRDLSLAIKLIQREVARAGINDILGTTGQRNVQGEEVQKLDVFAHQILINFFSFRGQIAAIGSEESPELIPINLEKGKYILMIDPLDGSSNIDVNIPVGTIFSIYKRLKNSGPLEAQEYLQKGEKQIAAGYVLFGASTVLVYTTGQGVNGFTLDPQIGEFLLTHPNIKIPAKAQYYSINDADLYNFPQPLQDYLADIHQRSLQNQSPLSTRYAGSLVADLHRNLLKGGIFIYPPTQKKPEGKLRLVYEANPVAFIIEQAGGVATNGMQNILTLEPQNLHQRTPLYFGPIEEMNYLKNFEVQPKPLQI